MQSHSRFNKITDLSADSNDGIGLAINASNTNNVIHCLGAHGNAAKDWSDGNANCDNDLWFFNF